MSGIGQAIGTFTTLEATDPKLSEARILDAYTRGVKLLPVPKLSDNVIANPPEAEGKHEG